VQDTIDQNVAFPLTGAAVSPDLVGITLATTISMIAGASATDRDTAIGQAAAAAQVYLNNLRVGDPLIMNDIAAAIRNSGIAKILDVGAPNRQIDEIYIWRSRADGSRYSRVSGRQLHAGAGRADGRGMIEFGLNSFCKYQERSGSPWNRITLAKGFPQARVQLFYRQYYVSI